MRGVSTFARRVHPCAWAALVFAVSFATLAGLGIESDGGGFFLYAIRVGGNTAVAVFLTALAGMGGSCLFIATYAAVSVVRALRDAKREPRGFEVVVPRAGPRAESATRERTAGQVG